MLLRPKYTCNYFIVLLAIVQLQEQKLTAETLNNIVGYTRSV